MAVCTDAIWTNAQGLLSEKWAAVTKAAIAEAVLALTKMDEGRRSSTMCLQTPSLWLALAALCLLQEEHVDRLSSAQWANPRGAVNKVRSFDDPSPNNVEGTPNDGVPSF